MIIARSLEAVHTHTHTSLTNKKTNAYTLVKVSCLKFNMPKKAK